MLDRVLRTPSLRSQLRELCATSSTSCQPHIETFIQQWRTARFDLNKIIVYCQAPDLHMRIEAFFAGIKTLLDLLSKLLSSEKVVAGVVDGFHRAQGKYGGQVINALRCTGRGPAPQELQELYFSACGSTPVSLEPLGGRECNLKISSRLVPHSSTSRIHRQIVPIAIAVTRSLL